MASEGRPGGVVSSTLPCLTAYASPLYPWLMQMNKPPYNFSGILKDLFDIVANKYGYCYTIYHNLGSFAGRQYANGSWSPGTVRLLVNKEADVILNTISLNHERARAVDFGAILYTDQVVLGYAVPKVVPNLLNIVTPFTLTTWIGIFFSLLLAITVSWILIKAVGIFNRSQNERSDADSFGTSTLTITQIFLGQPFSRTLKSYEFGLISGILVFMTIVNLVYKSNLAAVFIKPPLLIPFESVHQVAYQEAIPLRAAGGSYAASVILNDNESALMEQLRRKITFETDVPKIIAGMVNGDFAFITSERLFKAIMASQFSKGGRCLLFIGRQDGFLQQYKTMIFQKNSPYKQNFDWIFQSFVEFGISNKMYEDRVQNSTSCINRDYLKVLNTRPLALGDFYGLVIVYLAGVSLAFVGFLVELLSPHHQKKTNSMKQRITSTTTTLKTNW